MPVSMSLGILDGLITDLISLLVIRYPKYIKVLFSVPACWALGFVGDGAILDFIDFSAIIGDYFSYLLMSFGLIMIYPLIVLILKSPKKI